MYTEVGSFDAKAKLSQLLQEVKRGKRYTITLRGQPVADLVPSEDMIHQDAHLAIEQMRTIHKVHDVAEENLAKWIADGRL